MRPDLVAFLDSLRSHGWAIGVDQYIAAHRVALAVLPTSEIPQIDLRLALASVVCRTPQDQEAFAGAFNDWWAPAADEQPPTAEPEPFGSRVPSRVLRWAGWIEAFYLIGLAILVAVARYWMGVAGVQTILETPSARPIAYGVVVVAAFIVLVVFVVRGRTRAVLRTARFAGTVDEQLVPVLGVVSTPAGMQRIARQLRAPQETESSFLDIDRSVDATARQLGAFVPIMQHRRSTRSYLMLISREAQRDHVAAYASEVCTRMRQLGVLIDAYEFRGTPRVVWGADGVPVPLTALTDRHAGQRVVLVVDPAALIDDMNLRVRAEVRDLAVWPKCAVVAPVAPDEWHVRLLEQHGFFVTTVGINGFERLAEKFAGHGQQKIVDSPAGVPRELRSSPWVWRDRRPPERRRIDSLIASLRSDLTPAQFSWLKACAVYPSLQPHLTRYLGDVLGLQRYDADFLALARLPWFRRGTMPDWLRERLIVEMSATEERAVRDSLQTLLLSMLGKHVDERRLFALRLAKSPSFAARWAWRRLIADLAATRNDAVFHDRVLMDFLRGRRIDRLSVTVPREVAARLGRMKRVSEVRKRRRVSPARAADFTLSRRSGELIGVVLLSAGISVFAMLVSYHPTDPSAFYDTGNTVIRNWIGYYGATGASLTFGFVGFAGFLVPIELMIAGWRRFWSMPLGSTVVSMSGFLVLFIDAPALLDISLGKLFFRQALLPAGGYIGQAFTAALSPRLGTGGYIAAVVTIAVVSTAMWLRWSLPAFLRTRHADGEEDDLQA